MKAFWRFARMMLRYKRLLVLAGIGALFDAVCAAAGYGALMWIIEQLFNQQATAHEIVRAKLSSPELVKWVGDLSHLADYVPNDQYNGFVFLISMIFVLAVLGSFGRFMHQYFVITVSLRTVMSIRKTAFQRLVHLPLHVTAEDSTADNLSRIIRDSGQLARGFNTLTSKAVRDILKGLVALLVAFAVSWQLTGIFLIGVPIIGVLIRKFGKTIRRASKRANRQFGRMLGALSESLQSLAVVKVNQAEGYERRRFNTINRAVLKQEMAARTVKAVSSPVIELIGMAGVMGVAMFAGWLIYRGDSGVRPQDLMGVLIMLGVAGSAFRPLANLNNDLQQAAASAVRVEQVIELPVESVVHHGERTRGPRLPRHRRAVAFEHVTFTYPGSDRPAIQDVDLTIRFGTVCAIVGGNGSGKSTLVNLVPRLHAPTEGRVLIDDRDIAEYSLRSVREQIAMVTQHTVLFDGTIAENIRYGYRHATDERIIEAAERAHAHGFITKLPDGYDTHIGEWGGRLSGGQRQRLAIARAILRNPAILIMDEATSQIDTESEQQITEAMAEFTRDRTTFIIAHRMSTVVNADLIVVLEDGCIAATGRHDELLKSSDAYRVLCQTRLQPAGA